MSLRAEFQWIETATWLPTEKEVQAWINHWFAASSEALTVVIRCVGKDEIQQLNRDFRQQDKPTNVLSFPFEMPEGLPNEHLGDVIISLPVIFAEAESQAKRVKDHFTHMVLHGLLHLHGYDHVEDKEAQEMEALEIRLLSEVGISNPYN